MLLLVEGGGVIRVLKAKRLLMKKIVIALLLVFMVTSSSYAVNILDRALYKKVLLCAIHRYVLVHRLTGQVSYILHINGNEWILVTGTLQRQYQSMYKVQLKKKIKCSK